MNSQSDEPRWISKSSALAIYERLIAEHGGVEGVRDEGSLEAALAAPRNHSHYARRDFFEPAAAYAFAVTRNHPFLDGNRRLSLTLAGVFLRVNGYRLIGEEREAIATTIALANGTIGIEEFAAWLRSNSRRAPRPRKRK
ncbi:MAG: type II toxin-antitoxin system death-on-curing family toxin [Bacteroidota bacterium]